MPLPYLRFLALCSCLALAVVSRAAEPIAPPESDPAQEFTTDEHAGEPIGHGDGRIHIIPTLSAPSVKNGGKLTIQAVVKAAAGVRSVHAEILDGDLIVDSLNLTSGSTASPTLPEGVMGPSESIQSISSMLRPSSTSTTLWSAEWSAHNLEEKHYRVRLRVTDLLGHSFEDSSLTFTDPVAGITTMGTTDYPDAGLRRVGAHAEYQNVGCYPAVIDSANGYAYFGIHNNPNETYGDRVVKVALGNGAAEPAFVGAVTLNDGENSLGSAVIDPANGYAYFGTGTSPGRVVKVALGAGDAPPKRVGAVTLNAGEDQAVCGVIDAANGYAYFGTRIHPSFPGSVVKVALGVGDAPPTRVGALTLSDGENSPGVSVIDAANGYAYFGTGAVPNIIVKVALGAGAAVPTRVGALMLNVEEFAVSAAIDPANGYAYLGTQSSPGRVVKVALGAGDALPTRVGALTLNAGERALYSAAVDHGDGYAYFGTYTQPGIVVKVDLGAGDALPTRVGTVTLNAGEDYLRSAVIDPATGYAYFGTGSSPGPVVRVALGAGDALPMRAGALTLRAPQGLYGIMVDAVNGYAYCATGGSPGGVAKFALGAGAVAPTRVGAMTLDAGEDEPASAVLDAENGYAYFGTRAGNQGSVLQGSVVKVALGNGDALPTRVGAVTLNFGEGGSFTPFAASVIDTTNGYAYFGVNPSSGQSFVVKVALGSGGAAPTRVGAALFNPGESRISAAVIDAANGYAYFGTSIADSGYVVKVALGAGTAAPTRVGALALPHVGSAVIDSSNGYAYFGTIYSLAHLSGRLRKVALGVGPAAPTLVRDVVIYGSTGLRSAAIDVSKGYAYLGTYSSPSRVVKVALGAGDAEPTQVGAITLNAGEDYITSAGIDAANGFAYFGSGNRLVKVGLSQNGTLKATNFTLHEQGNVTDLHFYSHAAFGSLRLALYYNDAGTKNLLWQSDVIPNTTAGGFIDVPIASGTPDRLSLPPSGNYYLAWQVDTNADVPSYLPGAANTGFNFAQPFGPFPSSIRAENSLQSLSTDAAIATDENWTGYISYDLPENGIHRRVWIGYD